MILSSGLGGGGGEQRYDGRFVHTAYFNRLQMNH
uniref:Uncharacterized protein n=1 Tax=Lepeophtheirus salmonis TaxID=72036 RepID=A0A0K2VJ62_LEPSM